MIWSIKRILTIGLGFAIGVLALNALVTFGNIRNLIDSGRWVIHTREVLNSLDELRRPRSATPRPPSAATCSPGTSRTCAGSSGPPPRPSARLDARRAS